MIMKGKLNGQFMVSAVQLIDCVLNNNLGNFRKDSNDSNCYNKLDM